MWSHDEEAGNHLDIIRFIYHRCISHSSLLVCFQTSLHRHEIKIICQTTISWTVNLSVVIKISFYDSGIFVRVGDKMGYKKPKLLTGDEWLDCSVPTEFSYLESGFTQPSGGCGCHCCLYCQPQSVVTSEDRVKCQPVLMPSSSDIDILSQPFTWCEAKTHTGLMYLQSKAVWFGSEDLQKWHICQSV